MPNTETRPKQPQTVHNHIRKHSDASAPLGVLPCFVRFSDLRAAGIAPNWPYLLRLIAEEGFPTGCWLGRNTRAWRVTEIEAWLDQRPSERKAIPESNRRAVSAAKRRAHTVEHEVTG